MNFKNRSIPKPLFFINISRNRVGVIGFLSASAGSHSGEFSRIILSRGSLELNENL
jgi:hypothetical protein